jgi:hypothetical protein
MVLVAQVALITGVNHYNERYYADSMLGAVNIIVFFSLLIVIELIFRLIRRSEIRFKEPMRTMTTEEFENLIKQGE